MGFPLIDVLKVASTIIGTAVGGPLGAAAAAGAGAVADQLTRTKTRKDEQLAVCVAEWIDNAKALEAMPMTNAARSEALSSKIRGDLFELRMKQPKDREVSLYLQLALAAAKGDLAVQGAAQE